MREPRSIRILVAQQNSGTLGGLATCSHMVDRHSAPPNDLIPAVHAGDLEGVIAAIASGTDVNERDHRALIGHGNTPLHDAANLGHLAIVEALLKAGADPNMRCNSGWTPLLRACNSRHVRVVRRLLEAGADANLANDEGYTPLMRSRGDPQVEALLIAAGARP